jgi:formylglycine-generating enzyme required for sulfatase activity
MMKSIFLALLLAGVGFASSQTPAKPKMILVEGGTFILGDSDPVWNIDEEPAYEVSLDSYKIAKTETTVAQWRAFCKATGRQMPQEPAWGWIDSHPVVNISRNEAIEYCKWLSKKVGSNYRLPSSAEWEYAARGGNKSRSHIFSGSNNLEEIGWFSHSGMKTHPVGQKVPNELGLYDMCGNVWEWCSDRFKSYATTTQTNPLGLPEGEFYLLRGGSWFSLAAVFRITSRIWDEPDKSDDYYGFRVVSSLLPAAGN